MTGGVRWLRMAAWAAVYAAAAYAGRQLVMPETGLALLWPAAGVGALWLATSRTRREFALAAGLLTATLYFLILVEVGLPEAAWWSAAQVAQNAMAALLLRQVVVRRGGVAREVTVPALAPTTTRDVLVLGAVSVAAGAVGAVIGSLGVLDAGSAWSWWVPTSWTIRNGTGVFVVVALTASVRATLDARAAYGPVATSRGGRLELVLACATALAATLAVFGPERHLPLAFLVIPCALWFGVRFAPSTALAGATAQGMLVVGLTLAGRGPFAGEADLAVRATTVQLFLLLCCVLALLMSISVSERDQLLVRATTSETDARARADMLATVTRTMHDGLLVVDGQGRAVVSNPAARAQLGLQAERLLLDASSDVDGSRNPDGSVMTADERPALRALRGETVDQLDLARIDPVTGAARVLSVSAAPMDADGERLAVLVLSDVTEERARLAELKGFAGVMAHDLKGPIAGFRGWSEILDDQLDDLEGDVASARATLIRMQGSAERAQELIDDLLVYAQAGTGALDLQHTTLAAVWEQARAQLPTTTGDGCEIRYAEADDEIKVDVVLVRQLLVNLVGNALKYVAPGVIPRVRISSEVVGDRLHVRIADNGIGIPREEQHRVFEGFVRSSRTGTYPGTGLGLAICARAVQRHGGVIGARDAGPDGGTLISFSLPRPAVVSGDLGLGALEPDAEPLVDARVEPLVEPGLEPA